MKYLELRNNVWYATLTIPADCHQKIGKKKFKQTLETGNKRVADERKLPLIAKWKAQIKQARGTPNSVIAEAMQWRQDLEEVNNQASAEAMASPGFISGGEFDGTPYEVLLSVAGDRAEAIEAEHSYAKAKEFYDIATGVKTPTAHYFDQWEGQIRLAKKTKDQMVKDVALFVARFPLLEDVTRANAKKWINDLSAAGKGISSIDRILSFSRNYWRFLQAHDAVSDDEPLKGLLTTTKAAKSRNKVKESNLPYQPEDVVKLWEAAMVRPVGKAKDAACDEQLADLIKVGAYTGARIEELCSLKVADVGNLSFRVVDTKTQAGRREVPVHSEINDLMERLASQAEETKDEYLFAGLTPNKYGDRSNAIGKRFGRLKKALGFSEKYTFHSLRSTVITQLENAKVAENLAADIVGHEKPNITYGLYSGGADLETKREALELVKYPFKRP